MSQGLYELISTADGVIARIHTRGSAVLATPSINRSTASVSLLCIDSRGARDGNFSSPTR